MADFSQRYPRSAAGRFYVDRSCLDCNTCRELIDIFVRDENTGHTYLVRQPNNAIETERCEEAVKACPTDSIGNDGDQFDWNATAIVSWADLFEDTNLVVKAPVVVQPTTNPRHIDFLGRSLRIPFSSNPE